MIVAIFFVVVELRIFWNIAVVLAEFGPSACCAIATGWFAFILSHKLEIAGLVAVFVELFTRTLSMWIVFEFPSSNGCWVYVRFRAFRRLHPVRLHFSIDGTKQRPARRKRRDGAERAKQDGRSATRNSAEPKSGAIFRW